MLHTLPFLIVPITATIAISFWKSQFNHPTL
jgi:hypothetical protein